MIAVMEPHEDQPMTTPMVDRHTGSALSGWSRVAAWVIGVGRGLWLLPLDIAFRTVGLRYGWLRALFRMAPPRLLASIGQLRAERAAWRAARGVPAYRFFLQEAGIDPDALFPLGILHRLPETDKRSYVDRFGMLERCVGGKVPFAGTTIDESSGSTGMPYDWIRGSRERSVAHRNIGFFARYAFGTEPLVTINAFSMGAWATGVNMSLGDDASRHRQVDGPGPRQDPLNAQAASGRGYRYVISGYPPFLKHLLDEGDARGFPWAQYRTARDRRRRGDDRGAADLPGARFHSVCSGYGATDLEIGMAGESAAQRRLRGASPGAAGLRAELFGDDPRLPMVFQYNPYDPLHGDRTTSVSSSSRSAGSAILSPRMRYNVHDQGGLVEYARVKEILARHGFDLDHLGALPEVAGPRGPLPWADPIPLPFVWVNGRRDATISVMGANIYPEDVEAVLYRDPEVAPRLHSFLLSVVDDEAGTPRPGDLPRAHGPPRRRRGVAAGPGRVLRRRAREAQHGLPVLGRGVPQRDAADRPDLRPRRGPVPRRRAPDQAAADRDRVVRHGTAGSMS